MNRATKINAIDSMIDYVKDTEHEYVYFIPNIRDFSEEEIMEYEYELLGYYVTKHPLDSCSTIIKDYASIKDLPKYRENETVTIGGLIVECKQIITKKGQPMAFLQIEDLTGRVEVVVFSNAYKKYKDLLYKNNIVALSGKLEFAHDNNDDEENNDEMVYIPKILLYKIKPLEMRKNIKEYILTINKNDELEKIAEIINNNPGKIPIRFNYYNFNIFTSSCINDSVDVISQLEDQCLIKGIAYEN